MRIRSKVALVGLIPIAIAAAIALVAWILLDRAERAQSGAALAGAAYRDLIEVVGAHEAFIRVQPAERSDQARRFDAAAQRALSGLRELDGGRDAPDDPARSGLERYMRAMSELGAVTVGNDRLVAELNGRTASLVGLTDRARARQHESNIDIIASITDGETRLRLAREIVDSAQELRAALLGFRAAAAAGPPPAIGRTRIRNAQATLARFLADANRPTPVGELERLGTALDGAPEAERRYTDYVERLIKINSTDQRALHDEVTQLLTYAVGAAETEQATQNIAIEMLVLERRTTAALAGRDTTALVGIRDGASQLATTLAAIPISPLIQTEMIGAIDQWRDRLATAGQGLETQNRILAGMEATAGAMLAGASARYAELSANADRIGRLVRTILVIGAGLGLLLGAVTAYLVGRSIIRPVKSLQDRMIGLAAHPTGSLLEEAARRDELGAMARAANVFIGEIRRREGDLVRARDRADAALRELRDAQASLIQAEKLASLGQLVAGIAHEINTPVGVALTTATAVGTEVERLSERLNSGRVLKSEMARSVERLREGARLTFANLNRAADLVHGFKQIASDQASGERRGFDVKTWLHELLTSLGPILRRSRHKLDVECPEGITVDGYPGALAQIVTNLITNALHHAFPGDRAGAMTLAFSAERPGRLQLEFTDDGVGIDPLHRPKIFDPFYTTRRHRGSTGLGLHIVYNLVTVTLGGRIELDGRPGGGTRIRIDLPLRTPAPELPETAEIQR